MESLKNLVAYTPDKQVHSVTAGENVLEDRILPNAVNEAFVHVHRSMPPISNSDKLPTPLPHRLNIMFLWKDVNVRLKAIKKPKSPGPDSIPNWLLKEFAAELAAPVASIFNASVSQAQVPTQWKEADVISIPKTRPVQDINKDFWPISLTRTLSKILGSFFASWILESINQKRDPKQFGSISGCSAVDALISMLHIWCAETDGNGKTVRVFLLDFIKAFDHINHQVLISKMRKLDINQAIINWAIDFLSERNQRPKTCGVYSD